MGTSEELEPAEIDDDQGEPVLPFYNVRSLDDATVHVQAGYAGADDEVIHQAIDAMVGLNRAEQQIQVALGWWVDRWVELLQSAGDSSEQLQRVRKARDRMLANFDA